MPNLCLLGRPRLSATDVNILSILALSMCYDASCTWNLFSLPGGPGASHCILYDHYVIVFVAV